VRALLEDEVPNQKIKPENVERIIEALTTGQVTHDYPILVEEARELGLPITAGLPREIYSLMELYPQPMTNRPSVQYIPMPYQPRPLPEAIDKP
jgi:ClpP class serine protease